jgi:ribosomal protein L37AE/L43A
MLCSRCGRATSGPHEDPTKAVNIGVAAHITAASPGGPRYDPSLTNEQRADVSNGIWLCQSCAKLVDSDERRFPVERLRFWKQRAEQRRNQCVEGEIPASAESLQLRLFEPLQQLFDRVIRPSYSPKN